MGAAHLGSFGRNLIQQYIIVIAFIINGIKGQIGPALGVWQCWHELQQALRNLQET